MHLSHSQQLSGRVLPARQARSVRARTATLEPPSTATVTPVSGWDYLSPEAKERASDKKANKFEKVKVAKCGSAMWTEVHELAAHLRDGSKTWEELNLDDVDIRLKFAGMFHRGKRTPQRFMMRLKLPNGDVTSKQLRYLASVLRPYGDDGCGDITTRNNLQLRGVRLEDADKIVEGLIEHGMSSFQSGMDSVRNLTGSPIAGLDPHELLDVRPLLYKLNDVLFNKGRGNPEFANLPRKFNICISPSRDDFPHTQINDLGFEAVRDAETGKIWFNVVVGGLFSIKRNMMSIPLGCAVTEEQLIPFCLALLRVFRDHGLRGGDRQKTRLIWTIEELGGVEPFRALVAKQMGVDGFRAPLPTPHELGEPHWERRELLGVHAQKQEGLHWVGASVPSGRITADDMDDFARIADTYGDGSIRLTCEENVLFPNIPTAKLETMLAEPMFERFTTQPGPLERGMVSCTGSQFCGFGLVETKNRAMRVVAALEAQLNIPKTVRMHWTGCPNSCGQAQVADIGLMGAPARLDGKAVEGVKIFLGGKIGENPALADLLQAGVPADEEHLLPVLKDLLIKEFGATPLAA